jgi:hypothetical protein
MINDHFEITMAEGFRIGDGARPDMERPLRNVISYFYLRVLKNRHNSKDYP